jgi:urease accessory protein
VEPIITTILRTITAIIMPMVEPANVNGAPWSEAQALLPLFAWLSPSYPVGSYAYSHTLEWAVEAGDVTREDSLVVWLTDFMNLGAGRNDAILLCHAHRAVATGDIAALLEANELALALSPSAELHLETSQQGRSFLDATLAAWPSRRLVQVDGEVAFPIAVGMAAAAHGIPLAVTLNAYLFALVQTLVSAAIRLAPIGQTGGTKVCAFMSTVVREAARDAEGASLDDVGGATFRADLGSFHHENQYTRLFRS